MKDKKMTFTIVNELAKYNNTSRDYDWLADAAKKQCIICIIDYNLNGINETPLIVRDVASTCYTEKNGNGVWSISTRGLSYLTAFGRQEFINLCDHLHVEFIKPNI